MDSSFLVWAETPEERANKRKIPATNLTQNIKSCPFVHYVVAKDKTIFVESCRPSRALWLSQSSAQRHRDLTPVNNAATSKLNDRRNFMNRARSQNTNLRRILAGLLLMLTPLALWDHDAFGQTLKPAVF